MELVLAEFSTVVAGGNRGDALRQPQLADRGDAHAHRVDDVLHIEAIYDDFHYRTSVAAQFAGDHAL